MLKLYLKARFLNKITCCVWLLAVYCCVLFLEACIVSFLLGKKTEKREGCSGCCIFQVMIIEQLKTTK